jgi:multisubunit Na+/H+ antiporter MnhB subunit
MIPREAFTRAALSNIVNVVAWLLAFGVVGFYVYLMMAWPAEPR